MECRLLSHCLISYVKLNVRSSHNQGIGDNAVRSKFIVTKLKMFMLLIRFTTDKNDTLTIYTFPFLHHSRSF